jgi:hypothetical protein
MTTTVTTTNPVRSDVVESAPGTRSRVSRAWALAGLGAGICGIGTTVTALMADTVYQKQYEGNVDGIATAMGDKAGAFVAFHVFTTLGAVLMVVFAAGLYRRLRAVMSDSIAPTVAAAGLLGTAVVSIMGSGLDTEFALALGKDHLADDAGAAFYNHWVGTIPFVWTLTGLAGLAVFVASRRGAAPRWLGLTGLVLGGLVVLMGISILQYLSGFVGVPLILILSLGFAFGDRRFRTGQ